MADVSPLDQVVSLLRGDAPEVPGDAAPDDVPGDDAQDAQPDAAPDDATDVATPEPDKQNLAEEDTLDYKMSIPLGNGRDATLGELKDAYQAAETRELDVQSREAAISRQYVEIDELLYSVVDQLPPQLRDAAAQHLSRTHARASAAVLDVIPQWREETARQADFGLIKDLAKEYGLTAQIDHQLQYPSHPGTLQLLRDFSRLRDTVRKASGKLRAAQSPQSKIQASTVPRMDQGRALVQRAKQSGKQGDQVAAIAQLLRSK